MHTHIEDQDGQLRGRKSEASAGRDKLIQWDTAGQ